MRPATAMRRAAELWDGGAGEVDCKPGGFGLAREIIRQVTAEDQAKGGGKESKV